MLLENQKILEEKLTSFVKKYNTTVDEVIGMSEIEDEIIKRAKKLDLLAAAIAYIYSQKEKLNLKIKDIAKMFNVSASSVSQKAKSIIDVPKYYLVDGKIEFIDKPRSYVKDEYYDFLDSKENENIKKSINILEKIIKKDPNFFDPYISLSEYYSLNNESQKAEEIILKGYSKAVQLITKDGKFPERLEWGWFENRHIIRMIFHYGMLLWEKGKKEEAIRIFNKLLEMNPNDNIGARYAIAGILEGFCCMGEMEEKFASKYGFIDALKQEKWFEKVIKKHPKYFDWWLKEVGEMD